MEMYVQGVSTRKVKKVTEALCGVSFSKSTVSQLCVGLDAVIQGWRNRDLSDKRYPFLIVDALTIDIRRDGAIRSSGMLMSGTVHCVQFMCCCSLHKPESYGTDSYY